MRYKNISGNRICGTFKGFGEVDIPVDGIKELPEYVAKAFQDRTPMKILEPYTEEVPPVVTDNAGDSSSEDTEEDLVGEAIEEGTLGLEDLTKKELKVMLDERGIPWAERDNKTRLIQRLTEVEENAKQ